MREKFSTPESYSKKQAREEIEEGLIEHMSAPKSKEGSHPELRDSFETTEAKDPLRRDDFEKHVSDFISKNLQKFLPLLCTENQYSYSNQKYSNNELNELGITNENIGLLGANYNIEAPFVDNPQADVLPRSTSESILRNTEGGSTDVVDLLALSFAAANIRTDLKKEVGGGAKGEPHRYYFKPEDRYLCTNDFGMKVWNEEEGRMIEGDPTNANEFVKTVRAQISRIQENLITAKRSLESNKREELEEAYRQVGIDAQGEGTQEARLQMEEKIKNEVYQELLSKITSNPKDRELVFSAVPVKKITSHLHFHYDDVAKKYGFIGNNPVTDYKRFEQNSSRLQKLVRKPSKEEAEGASFNFVFSDFYKRPVLVGDKFDTEPIINEANSGVRDVLARRAVEGESEEVRSCFQSHTCGRGEQSPYFYPDYQVYDFIKSVGVEQAQQVLAGDNRDVSRQMAGLEFLRTMKYDMSKMEPDQLKKQLTEAEKLSHSGIWEYFKKREVGESQKGDWLESLSVRKSRDLFREGKRMYWLAQQVWKHSYKPGEEDRFYRHDSYVDWSKYDLRKADVPDEKLNEYLEKHRNLIVALLGQDERNSGATEQKGTSATLGLIMQALDRGQDLRGVALANDKQRYLEGVIKGEAKNDLEFAISDWPENWRNAVSKEEMELYYEYASDYVLLDPNGLTKYATWRASEEGKNWDSLFSGVPEKKSDLDFRICLGNQTEEVRNWYKVGGESVGNTVMQNYLLRFNATRGADGRMANLHDALYWVPNIPKLESNEARSIIAGIETMDDNQEFISFLPRYDKDRDPLKNQGSIQSLRELKKRVFAIESNIDMSNLPPQIVDIISAPGFNLSAFESMRNTSEFKDLLEGKLDKEQPFQPHSRLFAGRPLTESLREGLGSEKQKIRGTAASTKKLFYALNQMVKDREIGDRKMKVTDLFSAVPVDLEEDVIKLLQDQKVDIGPVVEAQVHAKSDPDGWVCGNYTDCCMPFGDSKNNDYMFNPSTQYFTVKLNGRIVAQSVVADSRDRRDNSDVVILDNIEVANNYKNLTPLLSNVYQTFWAEYTSKPVKVGTGYSDLIPPGGKLEENNYSPKTSLYYSDATGSRIYDLPKIRGVESMDKIVSFANLSERDAELIAKMEAEAYPEGLVQGKAHIADILQKQRDLEVPGAASSFVVRQGQEPAGYLLVLPEESERNKGERAAHIYDMAVLPKFRGSPIVRKMMERVLDVASAYNVPIEAEARASTSYALLMNERIRKWFRGKGFELTTNEKLPQYLGGEDFYFVRFENRQNVEVEA